MSTSFLDWRFLAKADRIQRQAFTCANPPREHYLTGHPRRWELEPQKLLRSFVCQDGHVLLGGFDGDGDGIAAMSLWDASNPDDVDLYAVGVANRWRRKGGVVARALMDETLRRILAAPRQGAGPSLVTINARVHRSNDASQRLCADYGFERIEPVPDTQYELWRRSSLFRADGTVLEGPAA